MSSDRFRAPRSISLMRLDGMVGDSYDNAMAESADGAYKTELVWRRKPFADLAKLELATFRWSSWWNSKRLHIRQQYIRDRARLAQRKTVLLYG